ncbi:MAG: aldo/keto reductase [Lentisphaeria bacterium]|nr:aldo/keto reductase [Lentisphaeria bacterium]
MATPSRREFLKRVSGGAVLAAGLGVRAAEAAGTAPGTKPSGTGPGAIPRRELGRTKASVSILGLGLGSAFTKPFEKDPDRAGKLLLRALDHGINYWDTSRTYGVSESLIGPALAQVRDRVFMVSKTGSRTYDGFMKDLEVSLRNLRTDSLDLYHMHNFSAKTDPDLGAVEKGALRAARKAREEGLIRAYGVSGHSGAAILMECIRRFDPDAVLTIFPADRPDSGRYEDELLPLARERNLGVIAMKTVRMAKQSDLKGTDLIRYAMSLDGVATTIVGLDGQALLDENAAMAAAFTPLGPGKRAQMTIEVRKALAGLTAPWDTPGYMDRLPA